jgi:phosphate transport system substrate-binding protein
MNLRHAVQIFCTLVVFSLAAPGNAASGKSADAVDVNFAGMHSLTNLFDTLNVWMQQEPHPIYINYAETPSIEVLQRITSGSADVGVTDLAVDYEELKQQKLVQFALMATIVAPVINLPGIDHNKLVLSAPVLADILLGNITRWDAKPIQALNPGLKLPAMPIIPIVRAEPSGITLAVTKYLSRHSEAFATRIGATHKVEWPSHVLRVKNIDGIVKAMRAESGTISFMESDAANRNYLNFAKLKSRKGSIVEADISYVSSSVLGAPAVSAKSEQINIVDLDENWPIIAPIYAMFSARATNDEKARRTQQFFFWSFQKGERKLQTYGYVQLPQSLQSRSIRRMRDVKSSTGEPLKTLFDLGANPLGESM